ncbi:hypothetical protein [Variovorax paradoxus]|uniref:Uncharacterized protein n=1 Tax=Variovorax paradoxus TaxID=34073 RepID=A0A679JC39_VARPD|nr:hypothetical protein VVAX_04314 [Variovorax paradoxus]
MRLIGKAGAPGVLEFRRADPNYWGRTMQARLLPLDGPVRDILLPLQYARLLTVKEGGILISGYEITSRGAKSKSIRTLQTWWCVVDPEPGYAVLQRMEVRSSTGFDVNDDDMPD